MANVRNANTFYIDTAAADTNPDTTGNLSGNYLVTGIFITASSASATIILKDVTTGDLKINLQEASSGETHYYDLSDNPMHFPNGISPSTVTNIITTMLVKKVQG